MGSKTRLGSYCSKRANNGVNLVTSRKINTRLARPIAIGLLECVYFQLLKYDLFIAVVFKVSGSFVETSCVFQCIRNIINAEMWA